MDPEELRAQLKKAATIGAFFALALVFYALGWRSALVVYVVIVGVLAVLAILLQSGRGGGLSASLGGLGGDSLLGTHSATPIAKATYVMLALFVFICMLTARMGYSSPEAPSLIPERAPQAPQPRPELPLQEPAAPGEAPAEQAPESPAE
jgi:preprotein translocase subunit SecG